MPSIIIEVGLVSILFIGYVVLWKVKKHSLMKEIKIDPEVIHRDTRPTQVFFSQLTRILTASVIALIILHGLNISNIPGFYRINIFDHRVINYLGFALGTLGLLICVIAQIKMGNSWRVGIDQDQTTILVTTGIFRFVRNPTYTGLFFLSFGVWMIFPTMAFLLWVLIFYISIEFQVRLEEEFLTKTHGEKYTQYSQTTKRYIPFLY
jgi:protein-S-isoprenylcysteine O-methyltransferase Ste14